MNEQDLRRLIDRVKRGTLSRRRFVEMMVSVGLTAPDGESDARRGPASPRRRPLPAYKPTKRGGGGVLRLLWWQAPTLLNPHFAVGQKDLDAREHLLRAARGVGSRRQPRADSRGGDTRAWRTAASRATVCP